MIISNFSKTEDNIMNMYIYDIRESVYTWFTQSVLEKESLANFWDSKEG